MKIDIVDYNGMKVICPSGEIDMHSSPELRKEIMACVGQRMSPLVVDLKDVTFIDSSGIATFVEGLKGAMSYGGKLKLLGLAPQIMEIFCFSKLDKVFEIHASVDEMMQG
jgi:anti-sigma B factor antagonist